MMFVFVMIIFSCHIYDSFITLTLPGYDEFSINCYCSDQTDTDDARATSSKVETIQEYNIQ